MIAAIDDRDFQIRKQRAEAVFKQAEADYRRISNLYEKGNISGTNYEKAKADYEKAQVDFKTAANELKDTKLYAPFDGYIQNVNIERYQEVKASYPIVSFIDLSQIKIEAYIPEDMAVNARKISADACNIVFNNLKGKTFVPEKTFVTQSATDNNISYLFTAIINNSDNSLLGGWPALYQSRLPAHLHLYTRVSLSPKLLSVTPMKKDLLSGELQIRTRLSRHL